MLKFMPMAENHPSNPAQDRQITLGLMAAVMLFVVLMSAIVLYITTNLIKSELGGSSTAGPTLPALTSTVELPAALPATVAASDTAEPPTASPVLTVTRPVEAAATEAPHLADATWTPRPTSWGFVRWLYWYVRPNRVKLGECVQITWETERSTLLQLYRSGQLILDNAPAAQTFEDCPVEVGYTVYRMKGVNNVGESSWIELQVRVDKPGP